MSRVRLAAAAFLLVALPPGASGQLSDGGLFELGADASYNRYDPGRLPFSDAFGVGLHAGWFFTRSLSLEASASRTMTRDPALSQGVEISELGATVLASKSAGGYNRVFAGVGYSLLSHIGGVEFDDHAVHAVLGDRVPLSRRSALRLEGRGIYTPTSNAPPGGGGRAFSMTFSVGVSFFLGSRPPRDTDLDLIPDRSDLCAATPAAVAVDATGCPRDSDGDGVYDGLDLCAVSPAGAPVGSDGCVVDDDGDGVPDYLDACLGSPSGSSVDERGCVPDSDGDGVRDDVDRCAATPSGTPVDASGCALDSDGDGVPDGVDRCEATPRDLPVDERGCRLLFEPENDQGQRQPLVLRGVNFELGQAVLTPESYDVLDQVAASLVANPEVRVEVAGHTDSSGSAELNDRLSLARAEAVRAYLSSQGVAAVRLVARGYGSEEPVADNGTAEGRAQNRRVELRLIEDPS